MSGEDGVFKVILDVAAVFSTFPLYAAPITLFYPLMCARWKASRSEAADRIVRRAAYCTRGEYGGRGLAVPLSEPNFETEALFRSIFKF